MIANVRIRLASSKHTSAMAYECKDIETRCALLSVMQHIHVSTRVHMKTNNSFIIVVCIFCDQLLTGSGNLARIICPPVWTQREVVSSLTAGSRKDTHSIQNNKLTNGH